MHKIEGDGAASGSILYTGWSTWYGLGGAQALPCSIRHCVVCRGNGGRGTLNSYAGWEWTSSRRRTRFNFNRDGLKAVNDAPEAARKSTPIAGSVER
jgi:hypothetical protein